MNGYKLSRKWFDFAEANPEKIKPNHAALYFYAVELCNSLGWKEKFSLPASRAMHCIGIHSYNTYKKTFQDLIDWKFFKLIQSSKNQYSANIIALSKFDEANDEATYENPIQLPEIQNKAGDVFERKPLKNVPDIDEERVRKATILIADFFNIKELSQARHFMSIGNFVRHQAQKGNIDYLAKQFTAYKHLKKKDPKYKHNWYNYIGSAEQSYEDGQWNIKDWVEELKNEAAPKQDDINNGKIFKSIHRTHELLSEQ
jgi:hypothetical protein